MKFVHHLFINTIVALNLIIAYEFFIVEPRISQLGSIVRVEAKNRIDADEKMDELKTKMDELETVLTEHKKRGCSSVVFTRSFSLGVCFACADKPPSLLFSSLLSNRYGQRQRQDLLREHRGPSLRRFEAPKRDVR